MFVLLADDEEDCFPELNEAKTQEKPVAHFNLQPSEVREPFKLLTSPEKLHREAHLMGPDDIKRAGTHLENVVQTDEVGDIIRIAFLHKLRSEHEDKPKVQQTYKEYSEGGEQLEVFIEEVI